MPISAYSGTTLFSVKPSYNFSGTTSNITTLKSIKPTPSTPKFLSGNTAALSRNFIGGKEQKSDAENKPANRRNAGCVSAAKSALEGDTKKSELKERIVPVKYNAGSYTSRYASCIEEKIHESKASKKLKEININGKPPKPTLTGDIQRQVESDSLNRNRQVVRLTIERDKNSAKTPNKASKTVAQKLIEKYTIPDNKEDKMQYEASNTLLDTGHEGDDELSDSETQEHVSKHRVSATRDKTMK